MTTIETSEAAQRLAAAILADIRLYNAEAIAQGEDLSEEIAEGRTLFRSRVVPQWHPLFEQALASSGLGNGHRTEPIDDNASHHHVISTPSASTEAPSSPTNIAWLLLGAVGLAATIAWQLLR